MSSNTLYNEVEIEHYVKRRILEGSVAQIYVDKIISYVNKADLLMYEEVRSNMSEDIKYAIHLKDDRTLLVKNLPIVYEKEIE